MSRTGTVVMALNPNLIRMGSSFVWPFPWPYNPSPDGRIAYTCQEMSDFYQLIDAYRLTASLTFDDGVSGPASANMTSVFSIPGAYGISERPGLIRSASWATAPTLGFSAGPTAIGPYGDAFAQFNIDFFQFAYDSLTATLQPPCGAICGINGAPIVSDAGAFGLAPFTTTLLGADLPMFWAIDPTGLSVSGSIDVTAEAWWPYDNGTGPIYDSATGTELIFPLPRTV